MFELLAGLVARSLVVAEEKGLETRYRLLETIRQYGEERLRRPGRPSCGGPATPATTQTSSDESATTPTTLTRRYSGRCGSAAEQDNLLAAWSWAIGTGNVDTAFTILAGFAPVEVWSTYPLVLAGEAALELPGAAEHPGYPLALAVSALSASNRADVTGAEELCRRAAEANARRDTPDWRVEETIFAARSSIAVTTRRLRRRRPARRTSRWHRPGRR